MTKYVNQNWKATKNVFRGCFRRRVQWQALPTASAVKERPDFIAVDHSARPTPSELHFLAS
jgi:hypothetical protein